MKHNFKTGLFPIIAAIFTALMLNSCCDCEDCLIQDPSPACKVKNGALIEFKAGVVKDTTTGSEGQDSIYFTPVEDFATETFMFPDDNSTSGSQPSDTRFSKQPLIVAERDFNSIINEPLTALIYDLYPPNLEIKGEILVRSIQIDNSDPLNSTARLRFYAEITMLSVPFNSENSGDFCEVYIPNYVDIEDLRDKASLFGRVLKNDNGDLQLSKVYADSYDDNDITVQDADGNTISYTPPSDVVDALLAESNSKYQVDIEVRSGEVYYVKARNGREFIMQISGIVQGLYPPYKKRVLIMFTPV